MNNAEEKIMCPKCEWKPDGGKYWKCKCGEAWNTFETYGKCPSCSIVYRDTQCPVCSKWSPHAEWYVDLLNTDIEIENTERNMIKI
jgi:RNA polymerase subunit RPABC4/transcription elongation factor Spt4